MIISQNKALDLHKSSHLMTLGKMKTPMDSIVTLLWNLFSEAGGKSSNGFMHEDIHLKKIGNFMHWWVLNLIQTQRKDLDWLAISIFTVSRIKGRWIKENDSS